MSAKDTEIDFGQYLLKLRRHWLLALLIFIGTTVAVTAVGFSKTPIYQAVGQLRFKSQDAASALAGIEDDRRGELTTLNYRESPIATEVGIMRTTPIVDETIETLGLVDEDGELLSSSAFLSNLFIEQETGTDLLYVIYQDPDPLVARQVVNTLMSVYLQQNLLNNRAAAVSAREFLEEQLPDAEERALQAEADLRAFKERNGIVALESETQATVESLGDLDDKITQVTAQLFDADARFRTLRSQIEQSPKSALVATSVSQSEGIQALLLEYQQVEAALAAQRTRYRPQHPEIVNLERRLASLRSLLDSRVQGAVGSQSAAASGLQMSEVEAALVGDYVRLEAQVNGLRRQAEALISSQETYSAIAQNLPKLEQEQSQLERQVEASRTIYTSLLQRLQEVLVAENQNIGNAQVVQPAEIVEDAVAPNTKLYAATGILLGSFLALSAALLLEAKNKSLTTAGDISKLFGFPVVGTIPPFNTVTAGTGMRWWRKKADSGEAATSKLVVNSDPYSIASESFYMLRSNLRFLNPDRPPRTIVVTSAAVGEGKSTVASNLAASIAQTGSLTLLIDANFYRPAQAWMWGASERCGLGDLLIGDAALKECVTEVMPHLMLLSVGSIPQSPVSINPVSILESKRMKRLMHSISNQFDYVIIDAPALNSGAIASILGKMSDGLLLVSRPEIADSVSANRAKELLSRFHQTVLGLVINGSASDCEPNDYFLSEEFSQDIMPNPVSVKRGTVTDKVSVKR